MTHAAVIGAGFGGIASALRLRALGYDVTLIDKQHQIGGKALPIESPPFSYDGGPTVITAYPLIDELFTLFGKKRADYIDFLPVKPFYEYRFEKGLQFYYGNNFDQTYETIARQFPGEEKGYKNLFDYSQKLYEIGYEKYGTQPFDRLKTFIQTIPSFLKLRAFESVDRAVSRFFTNPYLKKAFCVPPLLVGGNPETTPAIYLLIHYLENQWGVHYPKGGTKALVKALEKLLIESGVKLLMNQEVLGLESSSNQVKGLKLKEGAIQADHFVFNTDPLHFYNKLSTTNEKLTTRVRKTLSKPSMGLFVYYFSTSQLYPNVQHHTILLQDSFKKHICSAFNGTSLPKDLNIYLHRPATTDPSAIVNGCDSFYVLVPIPNSKYQRPTDQAIRDMLIKTMESTLLPNLSQTLCDEHFRSIDFYENEQNCTFGSPFTNQPRLSHSAYFRFTNKIPEYDNTFFTGAGTHPGAGIPGVLSSAKVIEKIFERM